MVSKLSKRIEELALGLRQVGFRAGHILHGSPWTHELGPSTVRKIDQQQESIASA